MVKNLHAMQDPDWGLIPGLRRASGEVKWVPTQVFLHGEFHGHRGACWTTIHGVTERHFHFQDLLSLFALVIYVSLTEKDFFFPSANFLSMSLSLVSYVVVVQSLSPVPDSLQLHGLQHARLPCPSVSPGVCSDSCPLSQ